MTEFFNLVSDDPSGIRIRVSNHGASLISVWVPDRDGKVADVVIGPETARQLETNTAYMGATVGRFANRVGFGRFDLDGESYQLSLNHGRHHLHGGTGGVHHRCWDVLELTGSEVLFGLRAADGLDGYPGNLEMTARYRVVDAATFTVEYEAQTDRATPVNLAQHAYWNLSGEPQTTVAEHEVLSDAVSWVVEIDEDMIPTGQLLPAADGPFDFRQAKPLSAGWDSEHPTIQIAGGYDHALVFHGGLSEELQNRVTVRDPQSGRQMQVQTNMPSLQLYSGNFLDGTQVGKGGAIQSRTGLCLETQHLPDSMNHEHFPSPVLHPGELYSHHMRFSFALLSEIH
ncbi:aldose epimerase family protein [Rubritalea marina]|uniref:aldose epimerase family protein n=1 Tax=Rubritalea marina TaxID=361055 RepID=UPI000364047D|nr:aldose epimerase family protein [Rubritalea marina]